MSPFFPPWEEFDLKWEAFPFPFLALLAKAKFSSSSFLDEEPSLVLLLHKIWQQSFPIRQFLPSIHRILVAIPTLWKAKESKAHHIIIGSSYSHATKLISIGGELVQICGNSIALLHLDSSKLILERQFPLVVIVLVEVLQCLPHWKWSILPMETRDNMVLNFINDDSSRLCHTLLPLRQLLCVS